MPTLVGGAAPPLAGAEGNSDGNGGTKAPLTTETKMEPPPGSLPAPTSRKVEGSNAASRAVLLRPAVPLGRLTRSHCGPLPWIDGRFATLGQAVQAW